MLAKLSCVGAGAGAGIGSGAELVSYRGSLIFFHIFRSLISISFIFAMSDKNSSILDAVMEHVICFLSPVDAFALGEVFVGCRQFIYRSLNNSLAVVLDSGNTVFRTGSDPLQSFTSLAKSLPHRSVCIRYV